MQKLTITKLKLSHTKTTLFLILHLALELGSAGNVCMALHNRPLLRQKISFTVKATMMVTVTHDVRGYMGLYGDSCRLWITGGV